MLVRLRFAVVVAFLIFASFTLTWAFSLIDAPSDGQVVAGVALLLLIFVVGPSVIYFTLFKTKRRTS